MASMTSPYKSLAPKDASKSQALFKLSWGSPPIQSHQLLTLKSPYPSITPKPMAAKTDSPPPAVDVLRPGLPEDLESWESDQLQQQEARSM